MRNKKWARLLAYVTGSVNQELLLQNEYLAAENRILRAKLPARLRLNDPERATLAEIGKRVERKALLEIASVARPDTILAWYRRLVAKKFDGSKRRQYPGRPEIQSEVEALVVRMAKENSGWGYDRIVGALANLGHAVSDQTVGNILRRHGIGPAPKRSRTTSWKDFIAGSHGCTGRHRLLHRGSAHMARADYLLRSVFHPFGEPSGQRCGNHQAPRSGVDGADRAQRNPGELGLFAPMPLGAARSRHEILCLLSVRAEGWRREDDYPSGEKSESERCCGTLGSLGQGRVPIQADHFRRAVARALAEFAAHYHGERNHQGKDNELLFPKPGGKIRHDRITVRRLGGLLNYYGRAA